MDIARCEGMIEIPNNKENFKKSTIYNYIKTDGTIYWGVQSNKDKSLLFLPRDVIKFADVFPKFSIKYDTVAPKVKTPIRLTGLVLRDYQQKPVSSIIAHWETGYFDCILQGETGFGKSYCVASFIEKMQLKTTIIVDKTLLAKQMYDEIKVNSNADVKILKKGDTLADVNITTYQLLMKNDDLLKQLQRETGLLIVDEVHIVAADSLVSVVSQFAAKYRLGLSATPTRSDGLSELIKDLFGRSVIIGKNPTALKVNIHRVECDDLFYSGAAEYKKKLDRFWKSQEHRLVELTKRLTRVGRKVCIAVDIQKTQEYYCKVFNKLGIKSAVLNSNTSAEERAKILKLFSEEKIDVLLGFAILEKGISITRLDTIINLSGASTKERVTQLIGRLKRDDERKKTPLFIDLLFKGNLEKQQYTRNATYHTMGDAVKVYNLGNFERYIDKIK